MFGTAESFCTRFGLLVVAVGILEWAFTVFIWHYQTPPLVPFDLQADITAEIRQHDPVAYSTVCNEFRHALDERRASWFRGDVSGRDEEGGRVVLLGNALVAAHAMALNEVADGIIAELSQMHLDYGTLNCRKSMIRDCIRTVGGPTESKQIGPLVINCAEWTALDLTAREVGLAEILRGTGLVEANVFAIP